MMSTSYDHMWKFYSFMSKIWAQTETPYKYKFHIILELIRSDE